ncbi:MAG: T9SS type A sorting domain-containing protein [Chitinophagales bacterium]|nr:T9SS type A sorting domain-containing protein [Chitinophagales bacterium]
MLRWEEMRKWWCGFWIYLSLSIVANAQTTVGFHEIDYIPVKQDGVYLKYPWAGGLNSAQFCDLDLNGDGLRDLMVYEKTDNSILTFIAIDKAQYVLDRRFIKNIPQIQGWVVNKDMNCDGIDDLLTYNDGSIAVYRGYMESDTLKFELWVSEILYQSSSGSINLYGTFVDRPAVADFDYDGDMDILTFNVSANRILLYKNRRVENGLDCDSLSFTLNDNCWGNVYESGFSAIVDMKDTCLYKISGGKFADVNNNEATRMRHAGSTLEAFDIRGRGVLDVLMGDVSYNFINHLRNDGDRKYASILAQDTLFPSYNTSVDVASFPLSTFIDIDHDGKKDLIVTPFEGLGVDNYQNVLFYKNIGNDSVHLSFMTRSFLVGDMLDVGENAAPAIIDIDGDGLKDMIIGGGYRRNGKMNYHLHYFKNIGSLTYPVFRLEEDDFLNFNSYGWADPVPAVGDLDGDGKDDLLLGLYDGRILFYRNISENDGFKASQPEFLKLGASNLDIGQNAAPCVFDIDRDGKAELFVGEFNGNINLYKNIETNGKVQLELITDSVGKIRTTTDVLPFGYSSIAVGDFYHDGKFDLFVGSYLHLRFVDNIEDSLFQPVQMQDLSFNLGRRVVPTFDDFMDSGDRTLLLGIQSGGVRWFSQNPPEYQPVGWKEMESLSVKFEIFPNPSNGEFQVKLFSQLEHVSWVVYNMMGTACQSGKLNGQIEKISLSYLPNGVYVFQLMKEGRFFGSQLFVKSR